MAAVTGWSFLGVLQPERVVNFAVERPVEAWLLEEAVNFAVVVVVEGS